jgi:trans-aconitate 2-methyltransferase
MMQDPWNPEQYARFRNERSQPYFDLLALVQPKPAMRVVDLGCGTGELTRLLHNQIRARETTGVDNSEAMLAQSNAFAGPGLYFRKGDITEFHASHQYDLVFSNAALQWVPEHPAVFARLAEALTPRGQLAVQVPAQTDHPAYRAASEVAEEDRFQRALGDFRLSDPVLSPEAYARLLNGLGFREQQVRLQIYGHTLVSREEVVEWFKGTLLTAYQRRLPPDLWEDFLAGFRAQLLPQLEDARPYFFPFKRILLWARL